MENTNQPDREGFHAMPRQKMSWRWGTVLWAILLFATGGVAGGAYHQMVQHHRLPHGSSISPVPHFAQRLRKDLAGALSGLRPLLRIRPLRATLPPE